MGMKPGSDDFRQMKAHSRNHLDKVKQKNKKKHRFFTIIIIYTSVA
jgi:hypothetical protein